MGWQAGKPDGTGGKPGPRLGLPTRQDLKVAGFTRGGRWDRFPPSADLAFAVEQACGAGWRCPGASHDQLIGLLRQWQALESWAAAGKAGVLRALVAEDVALLPGEEDLRPARLPGPWSKSLTHEVALALAMPAMSADGLLSAAWDLGTRLPGIGQRLAAGKLTMAKARAVNDALATLSDQDVIMAEELVLDRLDQEPAMTYAQLDRAAAAAALLMDPQSAAGRREDAEKERARVTMFREASGAAGLSGRDLPTDQTLTASARVTERAQEYKDSGAFGGTRMDQLRAIAYLDILNDIPAADRIAFTLGATDAEPDDPGPDGPGPDDPGPDDQGPDDSGPADAGGPEVPDGSALPPRLTDLVIPLPTLLGWDERPGESHGLGPLDPELCRTLAALAAASPHTQICITVTTDDGIATGHGCTRNNTPKNKHGPPATLPARLNITVTASLLAALPATPATPPGPGWSLTYDGPGPPGGHGTWTLTLPGGRTLTVALEPMPTFGCDHRHESHAYQPNDKLRHLVQVRDRTCTLPVCNRHARESDFEHATPYDQGGRTCGCNAGARSRACHQVKQSKGWKVTQPRPGWHQWETPSGRIYTQGPYRYPV